MRIQPQKVEKNIINYIKESLIHILKHPFLYMFIFSLATMICYFSTFLPPSLRALTNTIVGIFFVIWIMEVTFSSTQENYNMKKMLVSFVIATVGFKRLLIDVVFNTNAKFAALLLVGFCFMPSPNFNELSNFQRLFYTSNLSIFMNVLVFSVWAKFIITDPLILDRATGQIDIKETFKTCLEAKEINWSFILNSMLLMVPILFLSLLIPFSNIIQILIMVGFTLFSMDMYGINRVKKVKMEKENNI